MTRTYLEDAIKVIKDYALTDKSKLEEEIVVSMSSSFVEHESSKSMASTPTKYK